MIEKQVWLDKHKAPVRNSMDGYEFEGDCGRESIVVETDKGITAGLDERGAQEVLHGLRARIENAARIKQRGGDAYSECPRPGERRFRIAITAEDLDSATD